MKFAPLAALCLAAAGLAAPAAALAQSDTPAATAAAFSIDTPIAEVI